MERWQTNGTEVKETNEKLKRNWEMREKWTGAEDLGDEWETNGTRETNGGQMGDTWKKQINKCWKRMDGWDKNGGQGSKVPGTMPEKNWETNRKTLDAVPGRKLRRVGGKCQKTGRQLEAMWKIHVHDKLGDKRRTERSGKIGKALGEKWETIGKQIGKKRRVELRNPADLGTGYRGRSRSF